MFSSETCYPLQKLVPFGRCCTPCNFFFSHSFCLQLSITTLVHRTLTLSQLLFTTFIQHFCSLCKSLLSCTGSTTHDFLLKKGRKENGFCLIISLRHTNFFLQFLGGGLNGVKFVIFNKKWVKTLFVLLLLDHSTTGNKT